MLRVAMPSKYWLNCLMFEVPNGLDADSAAMTEPMAVALHAVRRSRVKQVNLRL